MSPTLGDGDFVLVFSPRLWRPRDGSVVVVAHPALGLLVKRIAEGARQGVLLQGDNRLSAGTAQLGPVPRDAIAGHVLLRVTRHGHIARVKRHVPKAVAV